MASLTHTSHSLKTKRDTYERRSRLLTSMFVKRESLPVVAAQGIAVISQAIALDNADHPENRPIALQLCTSTSSIWQGHAAPLRGSADGPSRQT